MRVIRTVFLLLLALVLVVLALANRQMVTLRLGIGEWLPGMTVTLPLFLIVLLVLMAGISIGLVWEWLRESRHRAQAAELSRQIASLQREVQGLRSDHSAPADEVLAILDAPVRQSPVPPVSGASVPARG